MKPSNLVKKTVKTSPMIIVVMMLAVGCVVWGKRNGDSLNRRKEKV